MARRGSGRDGARALGGPERTRANAQAAAQAAGAAAGTAARGRVTHAGGTPTRGTTRPSEARGTTRPTGCARGATTASQAGTEGPRGGRVGVGDRDGARACGCRASRGGRTRDAARQGEEVVDHRGA